MGGGVNNENEEPIIEGCLPSSKNNEMKGVQPPPVSHKKKVVRIM
jgi:hypothetical protein